MYTEMELWDIYQPVNYDCDSRNYGHQLSLCVDLQRTPLLRLLKSCRRKTNTAQMNSSANSPQQTRSHMNEQGRTDQQNRVTELEWHGENRKSDTSPELNITIWREWVTSGSWGKKLHRGATLLWVGCRFVTLVRVKVTIYNCPEDIIFFTSMSPVGINVPRKKGKKKITH